MCYNSKRGKTILLGINVKQDKPLQIIALKQGESRELDSHSASLTLVRVIHLWLFLPLAVPLKAE